MSLSIFDEIAKQLERAVALEYKGIVFDDWTVDEEYKNVWGEMCQDCADKHMDVLADELSEGGIGACSVKGCEVVGADFDNERHYYVDFQLEHIQALTAEQLMERYPDLITLDEQLFALRSCLIKEDLVNENNRAGQQLGQQAPERDR